MAQSIQRSCMQFDHQKTLPTTSLDASAAASIALFKGHCYPLGVTPLQTMAIKILMTSEV
jgi:hypothetical protein